MDKHALLAAQRTAPERNSKSNLTRQYFRRRTCLELIQRGQEEQRENSRFYNGLKRSVDLNRELTLEKMSSMGFSVPLEWRERDLGKIARTTTDQTKEKALRNMRSEERKQVIGNRLISHDMAVSNTDKLNFFEKVVPMESPLSPSQRTKTQMQNRHKLIYLAVDGETQLGLFRPLVNSKQGSR